MENERLLETGINDLDPSASAVPGRKCMWLISLIFVFASTFLTTEFILLHQALNGGPTYYQNGTLINFFGTLEAILWLQGFMLLLYWAVYEIPFSGLGVTAVILKLLASCFFNIQPASGLLLGVDVGVTWSNFVGICLFHSGNLISTYDMRKMFDASNFWGHGNLPVLGMWVYTLATTLLITADGLDYYKMDFPNYIAFGQISGAVLLGVGSLIYCQWSRPSWIFSP
eukprot:m.24180 g.24180  ORF g.24180 m.24180 type:complete len:227 (-) comp7583_c0_seq1:2076-2756(-)